MPGLGPDATRGLGGRGLTVSARLPAYLGLGGAGLLAGLLLGRPEPVVLATPLLLAAAVGLALARRPELAVTASLDRDRAVEGEEVELTVEVRASRPVSLCEVEVRLPPGLSAPRARARFGLRAGEARVERLRLACERWGGRLVGDVLVRARDPLGFFTHEVAAHPELPLRVCPRPELVRRTLRAVRAQAWAGDEVSRFRGEGIEFAGIRPFAPGDAARRVNWRATARRGQLQVNEMHPERNRDVVLFLDTFTDLRDADGSSLETVVRAAASLAEAHLRRRDRVGLVGFGGTLRWLRPGTGERQLQRLVDALIDTEVVLSYAWKGLEVIPRRMLPPQALVIALSPLLDERSVAALVDLRGRGHDVAVIEVSPLAFVPPGPRETQRLAYRLWEMEREALRGRFLAAGVPVAEWSRAVPLDAALAVAARIRRSPRLLGPAGSKPHIS